MKGNKIERKHRLVPIVAGLVAIAALAIAAVFGYDKLNKVCHEQCIISDFASQVEIKYGKMVKADIIAENLGLRNGANPSEINFEEKCAAFLEKVPNLLSIHVSREMPNKVRVVTEERTPVARIGVHGNKKTSGLVVDTEGMVFVWERGTHMLPLIRVPQASAIVIGKRIKGRTLAALRLIEACREPELLELGALEVDTSKKDFLVVTLGNYSKLKICWDEMDESTPNARVDLVRRLTNLRDTIRTRLVPTAVIWNATIPKRIFADTQDKL